MDTSESSRVNLDICNLLNYQPHWIDEDSGPSHFIELPYGPLIEPIALGLLWLSWSSKVSQDVVHLVNNMTIGVQGTMIISNINWSCRLCTSELSAWSVNSHLNFITNPWNMYLLCLLQMRKLRQREAMEFVQDHSDRRWWNQEINIQRLVIISTPLFPACWNPSWGLFISAEKEN